jgi:hypothetical protein
MFICDHCPTVPAFTECISVEGSQRSIVLCFSPFCPISTKFFCHPIKYQRLEEPEVEFEKLRMNYLMLENQLPIPNQNMHDPRSAWTVVMYNIRRPNNFVFDQLYVIPDDVIRSRDSQDDQLCLLTIRDEWRLGKFGFYPLSRPFMDRFGQE